MSDVVERLNTALEGRYRIERELGAGGMATVFLADDVRHRRRVAVKVLLPELAVALGHERFLREIETTANLRHPHILPLYDSGEANGFLYYVMPFVEGESLRDRLDREKQLPLAQALQVAREVADALGYAHGRGIVHRDIKPENILLESGHAVVADFGIARALTAAGAERLTVTGTSVGTPIYMSPEQAAGETDLDGRSDLYSLACVTYEMLAGQPPFTGPTVESVVHQHLVSDPPAVTQLRPAVPAAVTAALQRALAKAPADRFDQVALFAEAMRESAAAAGAAPARARRSGRWAAAAVALVVVAAAVALLARPWTGGPEESDRSIAVLPFQNLSGDEANAFFAAGVHEDILTHLTRVRDVRVISRTSVMPYADGRTGIRDVARELRVNYVMKGSVRRDGGRVRVTAQLIDARSDQHLWAENFDGDLADVFGIQTTIAQAIVKALEARLSPEERRRLAERPTESIEAYDLFLRARALSQGAGMLHEARVATEQLLEQAIAVDPGFALAHAMLGETRTATYWSAPERTPDRLAAAKQAIDRAFQLRPDLPEAHLALAGYYYRGFYDYPRALEQLEIARRGLPGSAEVLRLTGLTLRRVGRWSESVDAFEEATQLDPANLGAKGEWFWTSILARQWDRAGTISRRLGADHPRNGTFAAYRAAMLLLANGDTAGAREQFAQADEADEYYYGYVRVITALYGRDWEGAIAAARRYARHFDLTAPGTSDLYAAEILLAAGDSAGGRRALGRALGRLEAERARPYAASYVWPHVMAGLAHALSRDGPLAREACARRLDILPESRDKVHGVSNSATCAQVLALVGDSDLALAEIERLLEVPNGFTRWELALDPRWDFFRGDARFRALATPRRMNP
jgi:eukaryotic-like serine/threonine-protein kinase